MEPKDRQSSSLHPSAQGSHRFIHVPPCRIRVGSALFSRPCPCPWPRSWSPQACIVRTVWELSVCGPDRRVARTFHSNAGESQCACEAKRTIGFAIEDQDDDETSRKFAPNRIAQERGSSIQEYGDVPSEALISCVRSRRARWVGSARTTDRRTIVERSCNKHHISSEDADGTDTDGMLGSQQHPWMTLDRRPGECTMMSSNSNHEQIQLPSLDLFRTSLLHRNA